MNIALYIPLLSFSFGLVTLISSSYITNPIRVTDNVGQKIRRKTRVAQSEKWIQDEPLLANLREDQRFGNNLEDRRKQYELEEGSQLREANPTLHKHKLKHKIHSHIIPHGHVFTGHLFANPIIPSINLNWHHSHKIPTGGYNDKNVHIFHPSSGLGNWDYDSFKPVPHSHVISEQNTNLFSNQNVHLNTHIINNQNTHLINQINHFDNGHRSNVFTNDRKQPHNFFIVNSNGNVVDSSENIRSTIYDSEMDDILNILDERSYQQDLPSTHEERLIEELGDYDGSVKNPQECTHIWYEPDVNNNVRENSRMQKNSKESGVLLQSPNIIQIPYNINYDSYRWGGRRNERSSEDANSTKTLDGISTSGSVFNNDLKSDKMNNSSSYKNLSSKYYSKNELPNNLLNDLENMNDTFEGYRNMINSYRREIKPKEELIFADFLDGFVDDFQNKQFDSSNDIKKLKKRSASIIKLFNDPNVKLDVPKTLENIGTITRNAFEDERAPMYHVRNLMGSTKNAVLSAMRIPSQNFFIPSNYQIDNINPEEISADNMEVLGAINQKMLSRSNLGKDGTQDDYKQSNIEPNDPFGIVDTFNRVGGAIRDSVRSGQNTLAHIGDIAHNARKIYYSAKNTAPRVFIPYANAPVMMRSRFKVDSTLPITKKAVIITPKIMAIKEPALGSKNPEPHYVKMGNILDAIGISKPDEDKLDLERFVIKTPENGNVRGIYIPPIGDVKSVNGNDIPDLSKAKNQMNVHSEKVLSSKDVVKKTKNDIENKLAKSKTQAKQMKEDIEKRLQYHKKRNEELASVLHKNKFKSYRELESRLGNILHKNEGTVKNFTKEEEQEIIDTFLDNIFKMDKKHDAKSKSILFVEKKKPNKEHSNTFENILKNHNTSPPVEMKHSIAQHIHSHGRSEDEVNELMKNLTLGIPIDEIENSQETKNSSNKIRKNRIHKPSLNHKKDKNLNVKPEILLESRFTGDNDKGHDKLTGYPQQSGEDDEDIKKVDEYVVNHIVSSKNNGNIQQFNDDSSVELSDNLLQKQAENVTPYSSGSLSWFPKDRSNNQLSESKKIYEAKDERKINKRSLNDGDGLSLEPELMNPFLARASDGDIGKNFDSGWHNNFVGNTKPEHDVNFGKHQYMFAKHEASNVQDTISGVTCTYLNDPVRSRATDGNTAQYAESSNPNLYIDEINRDEAYEYSFNPEIEHPMYNYFGQEDGATSLENSRRNTEQSEYTLCSPYSPYRNPILCGHSFEYPQYLDENELEKKHPDEEKSGVGQSRNAMMFSEALKKPFMGLENRDAVKKFYEEYNGDGFMDHYNESSQHLLFSDY